MQEVNAFSAVRQGLWDYNRMNRFNKIECSIGLLAMDIERAKHRGASIILPANNSKGYEIVQHHTPPIEIRDNSVTVEDLWDCTKQHYGLTIATGFSSVGAIPIKKSMLGHYVHPGSSKYTNIVSHMGTKFFPRAKLKHGSTSARIAKSAFGTVRIFGIVGRALPFAAVGLAVFDIISIGQCVYQKKAG